MSQTTLAPETVDLGALTARWMVVIFNNDATSMDEVVNILMEATGCDVHEAYIEMWEAHTFGRAPVHFASEQECEQVATVIQTVGVVTEVCLEWGD